MADASRAQPDFTNAAEPPATGGGPRAATGHQPAQLGAPSPGATAIQPSTGAAGPPPEAKLRRLGRSALITLVIAWLAAAVAVLAALPDGFVVTRWWAYGLAFLALNTAMATLVLMTGDGLRHLLLGADHRTSTSKAQVAAWTYLVVFALGALLLMGKSLNCPPADAPQAHCVQLRAPLVHAFDAFRTKGLQPAYLLLLGLPTAAAVAAKAITTTKVAAARSEGLPPAKTPAPDANVGLGDRVAELVSDDGGDTDLGDLQYQLFNLLTMAWFLVTFLPHPLSPDGLPDLPATLIGLTGVSTAGYVTKKALEPATAGDPGSGSS